MRAVRVRVCVCMCRGPACTPGRLDGRREPGGAGRPVRCSPRTSPVLVCLDFLLAGELLGERAWLYLTLKCAVQEHRVGQRTYLA